MVLASASLFFKKKTYLRSEYSVRLFEDMIQTASSLRASVPGMQTERHAQRGKSMRGHLPGKRSTVRIRVALPTADYRAFTAAARLLTQIMGVQAPATAAIIQAQLDGRSSACIADQHLEAVGWPLDGADEMGRTA